MTPRRTTAVADPPAADATTIDLTDDATTAGNGKAARAARAQAAIAPDSLGERLAPMPLALLKENPDNPRRSVLDVDELVASIRAHGVVQGLVVVPAGVYADPPQPVMPEDNPRGFASSRYVIVAGHRRWKAAAKAGLAHVPVQIRTDLDRGAAHEVMLIENLHREDLTKFEEARGYRELTDKHGLTQQQIADKLGVNQSHVSRMLAIARLPEECQADVLDGEISIQDAAEVAAVVDEPEVFKRAWDRAHFGGKRAVEEARRAITHEQKRTEQTGKLKARGIKVLGSPPAYYRGGSGATRLDVLELRARDHQKEPCHAAYVERGGQIVYCCTKPKNHAGGKSGATGSSTRESAEAAAARVEREQVEAAASARVAFIRPLLKGRGPAAKQTSELLQHLVVDCMMLSDVDAFDAGDDVLLDLLGLTATNAAADPADVLAGLLASKPRQLLAAAVAFACFETRLQTIWRREWDSLDGWYLEFLESEYGHDLTEVEHTRLGHKRKGGVWTRPDTAAS